MISLGSSRFSSVDAFDRGSGPHSYSFEYVFESSSCIRPVYVTRMFNGANISLIPSTSSLMSSGISTLCSVIVDTFGT